MRDNIHLANGKEKPEWY